MNHDYIKEVDRMKKILPILCIAAVLTGCGKVDQASKKDSMPVVKGGTVMTDENTTGKDEEEVQEKSSEAKGQTDNFKPADKARGEEKQEPTTHKAYVAGQRKSDIPTQTYIPKPVRPSTRSTKPAESVPKSVAPPEKKTETPTGQEQTAPRVVFSAALSGIMKEGNVPGHGQMNINLSDPGCKFAVGDLEGDGSEEMIFVSAGSSAEAIAVIYGVDEEGKLYEKASVYPDMTIYSNGTLIVRSSHAQGPSGDFMPYTIMTLSADGRRYEAAASVDAIDRAQVETAAQTALENGSEPPYTYPEDVDTSNSGVVYIIGSAGGGDARTVDVTEYESWLAQFTGGASAVSPDFRQLSADNIRSLTE